MKVLSVLMLALALTACGPTGDPNTTNAAFAAGLCSQNVEQVWNATDVDLQAEFTAAAEFYGLDAHEMIADSIAWPDGTICNEAKYVGAYKDRDGNAASMYVFTFTDETGTWSIFYLFTSTTSGVVAVQ